MKCPTCQAVCEAVDFRCPLCGTPTVTEAQLALVPNPSVRVTKFGVAFMAAGVGIAPILGGSVPLVPAVAYAPAANLVLWGAIGAGIGAIVGYAVGYALSWVTGRDHAPA